MTNKDVMDLSVMVHHAGRHIDDIDSRLFNGFEFNGVGMGDQAAARRNCLRAYCERWLRQLDALDGFAVDDEIDSIYQVDD